MFLSNALIEVGWIAATVYLVMNGHPGWAIFTATMAFLGIGLSRKVSSGKLSIEDPAGWSMDKQLRDAVIKLRKGKKDRQ